MTPPRSTGVRSADTERQVDGGLFGEEAEPRLVIVKLAQEYQPALKVPLRP